MVLFAHIHTDIPAAGLLSMVLLTIMQSSASILTAQKDPVAPETTLSTIVQPEAGEIMPIPPRSPSGFKITLPIKVVFGAHVETP